jgi:hypothetical protein
MYRGLKHGELIAYVVHGSLVHETDARSLSFTISSRLIANDDQLLCCTILLSAVAT